MPQPISASVSKGDGCIDIRYVESTGAPGVMRWYADQITSHQTNDDGTITVIYGDKQLHITGSLDVAGLIEEARRRKLAATSKKSQGFELPSGRGVTKLITKLIMIGVVALAVVFGGMYLFQDMLVAALSERIPTAWEAEWGKQAHEHFVTSKAINKRATMRLQKAVKGLKFEGEAPKVFVLKGEEINAFASPGGYIYVHEGMLRRIPDGGAFAALIGHEYGHIHERHVIRQIVSGIGITTALTLSTGGAAPILTDQMGRLLILKHSRQAEESADHYAGNFLLKNQLSANDLVRLLKTLDEVARGSYTPPEFLSTHPDTRARISDAAIFHEGNNKELPLRYGYLDKPLRSARRALPPMKGYKEPEESKRERKAREKEDKEVDEGYLVEGDDDPTKLPEF